MNRLTMYVLRKSIHDGDDDDVDNAGNNDYQV